MNIKKTKKNMENPQRNNRTERFSGTFIVGVMLLVTLFSLSFVSADIFDDNIMYWDFNEGSGTNLEDITGNGHDGTLYGGLSGNWTSDGILGNALNFTADDNNYVNYTSPFVQNWTISFWVKLNVVGIEHTVWSRGTTLDHYIGFDDIADRISIEFNNTADVFTTTDIDANVWMHFVITMYENGSGDIYKNGSLIEAHDFGTGSGITDDTWEFGRYVSDRNALDGILDEIGIWNRTLTLSEVGELYNSGSGLARGAATATVTINLLTPIDDITTSDVGENFTASYSITPSFFNFTNMTYYLWNSTGGVFNNSVRVNITGTSNTTNEYIDDFVLGDFEWNAWTCYENDSDFNCSWASSNYSFFVGASIDQERYNNVTYETSSETFITNLTLLPNASFYDAQLDYNGTLHEGTITDLGSDKYLISTSLDIPLYTYSSFNWHWKLTYETSGGFVFQNLTTYTQNVSKINLSTAGCVLGDNLALNFSAYNEENLTRINGFSFDGTFEYWLGTGNIRKNFSVSNASIEDDIFFCISPNNLTYHSTAQIQYEKEKFVKRSYYLVNTTLTNTTKSIGLYLLNSTRSTSFIINVIDSVRFPIEDAYLYIQRYYPGTGAFHTIEMARTDESGNTIGHFEAETEEYKVIVFKDGQILYESNKAKVFCGETPCTLNYQTEATAPAVWEDIGDIPNLIWSLDYDEDTQVWTYTYVDTSGTTNYGRLFVYIDDGSKRTIICNNSDTSSAATLTCNVSGYDGTIYAEAYISRSPEILTTLEYIIQKAVKAIFGMEGLFWATIILLVIGLVGVWNPSVGVIMMIAGIVLINYLQLASLGITTIIGISILGVVLLWEMKK